MSNPLSHIPMVRYTAGPSKRLRVMGQESDYNLKVVSKPHFSVAVGGKVMYTQVDMTPAAPVNALNVTTPYSFFVEQDALGVMKHGMLRWEIKNTGGGDAAQILPTTLWHTRIEIINRKTGQEIARYHDDIQHLYMNVSTQQYRDIWGPLANFDAKSSGFSNVVLENGETKYFYLPLDGTFLDGFDLDFANLQGDLEFKFYPRGDPYTSADATLGSAGNSQIDVLSLRLIAGTDMLSRAGEAKRRQERISLAHQRNFSDFQQYYVNKSITAGTEFTLDLEQFHHQSGLLLITIRENKLYDGIIEYTGLGPKATFDHVNVHNKSMMGNGTSIDGNYMKRVVASQLFPTDFINRNHVYVIPFSRNLPGAWDGVVDGLHTFRGDRERIRIIPDQKGTNMIRSYAAATGTGTTTLQIGYKGMWTPLLTLNSTVAVLKAAVDKLTSVQKDGFRATFSGVITSAFTINYTEPGGTPFTDNSCGRLEWRLAGATPATTVPVYLSQTYGVPGFRSDSYTSDYRIDIYSLAFKNVQQARGMLKVQYL